MRRVDEGKTLNVRFLGIDEFLLLWRHNYVFRLL